MSENHQSPVTGTAGQGEIRVGVLGAGHMGQTLAHLFVGAGHWLRLTNSREPESLGPVVAELGPRASAATPEQMIGSADVVVLATRWEQISAAVEGIDSWDGKVVIDTTNNRTGPDPEDVVDIGGQTSSEVVAEQLPGARIVKAFNHVLIPALAESFGDSPSEHNALFVAGDDPDAKQLTMRLIRDVGGEPIDTGGLREGGQLYGTGGPLAGLHTTPSEARSLLAEIRTASQADTQNQMGAS